MSGRRAAVVWAAVALAAGCGGNNRPGTTTGVGVGGRDDPGLELADLERDLQATVLEGYIQLSLGNFEAFADTVSDDDMLVLIEIAPQEVYVGYKRDRKPGEFRIDPCNEIKSKNLEIHLAADGLIGWVFDEISCRVPDPFEGRQASIPLRYTAVYRRHVDSWVMVMLHVSYALPADDIADAVRSGSMRRPIRVTRDVDKRDGVALAVRTAVDRVVRGDDVARQRRIASDPGALVVLPRPEDEYHGEAIATVAPQLAALFDPPVEVEPRGYFIQVAPNQRVAWVATTLDVTAGAGDDVLRFGLRATYVFERRDDTAGSGWTQVQAHVSAPMLHGELSRRVFGLELPDLSQLPTD